MKRSRFKLWAMLMAMLMVILMIVSIFCGCKKTNNGKDLTGSQKKTTAASGKKTTKGASSKSSSRSTSNAGTDRTNEGDETTGDTPGIGGDNGDKDKTGESGVPEENIPEKVYDLGGRVIKVISSSAVKDGMLVSDGSKVIELTIKRIKEAEVIYNCDFVFEKMLSWAELQKDIESTVLAGVYYCDMFRMTRTAVFPKYEKNNIILPLNDYIDFEQPLYKQYDQINGLIYPEKIYSFFINGFLTPLGVFYNKDITAKEGIQDIHEIADSGNWNWDTFADIAVKMTKDNNGDGIIDQYGVGADNSTTMCFSLMRSNLAAMIDRADDNSYVYNLGDPKALRALQFVSDLYHVYKVVPATSALPYFQKGNAGMYIKDAWYGANLKNFGLSNFGFEILPDGPDNPGNAYMRELGSHMYFFPSTLKDPEAVVNAAAFWNVLWDESKDEYLTADDMLRSNAEVYFTNDADIENFIDMVKTRQIKYDYVDFFSPSQDEMRKAVFYPTSVRTSSPVSSIISLEPLIKSIIDEAMN